MRVRDRNSCSGCHGVLPQLSQLLTRRMARVGPKRAGARRGGALAAAAASLARRRPRAVHRTCRTAAPRRARTLEIARALVSGPAVVTDSCPILPTVDRELSLPLPLPLAQLPRPRAGSCSGGTLLRLNLPWLQVPVPTTRHSPIDERNGHAPPAAASVPATAPCRQRRARGAGLGSSIRG